MKVLMREASGLDNNSKRKASIVKLKSSNKVLIKAQRKLYAMKKVKISCSSRCQKVIKDCTIFKPRDSVKQLILIIE